MREFKHRTTDEARDALQRFIHQRPPIMTIPLDNERDADCILSDVISERDALLERISELTAPQSLPRRKYVIKVKVDGHTWGDALVELMRMADHVHEHGELCSSVGGGGPSGHQVDVDIHPNMPPEKFDADLQKWAEERKAKKAAEQTAGQPQ